MTNFFIYANDGSVVGNPKGYRTHNGAVREAYNRPAIRAYLWALADAQEPGPDGRVMVFTVKRGAI